MDASFYENFSPPPDAPCYQPSDEEFKDPLAYIAKIKPTAEKYGIVKIKPPASWTPPFAIDAKTFRFRPRIQKLNELDALNRIRLNFMDSIAKFWNLQGIQLKVPLNDDGHPIDLYLFRKVVAEFGGFEECCSQRRWTEITKRFSFKRAKDYYEKMIVPYDLYESGLAAEYASYGHAALSIQKMKSNCPLRMRSRMLQCLKEVREIKQNMANKNPRNRSSKELKNLEFYGAAGPKFLSLKMNDQTIDQLEANSFEEPNDRFTLKPCTSQPNGQVSKIDTVLCQVCRNGDEEHCLLLCDTCDQSFHTYCLLPPLLSVPNGDWRCPSCITEEVKKPPEAYGFGQADNLYSLHSFGEMADRFKSQHFGRPAHTVPCAEVEKEYWRLLYSKSLDVAVEYGADLLTDDVGSGFPKMTSASQLDAESEFYAKSPWNLNNLSVADSSVLSHITVDISGMKVPWIYVGMCFSTFCWHTEDHWSYSINYLHWGEPKTWYGVSGLEADQFEATMKELAPELFATQPDLLHHLVTMANPRLLAEKGLRVSKTNQCAGEFVVTFPRSYHAGFNQGFNFAEAVNFCPSDWLSMGRRSIENYSQLGRVCVFSHDELIVTVAQASERLQLQLAVATRDDLAQMIEQERRLRRQNAPPGGNCSRRRVAFELMADEQRQCVFCSTTCYLSSAQCQCSPERQVCLRHIEHLCNECPSGSIVINYRFEDFELDEILDKLNNVVADYDHWCQSVQGALQRKGADRLSMEDLRGFVRDAELNRYPMSELRKSLKSSLKQIEKCSHVADQLVDQKIKSKSINNVAKSTARKLRLEEVEQFAKNLERLCCKLPQADAIIEFIADVRAFKRQSAELLSEIKSVPFLDGQWGEKLNSAYTKALSFDLQLPEIPKLKLALASVPKLEDDVKVEQTETLILDSNSSAKRIKIE